MICMIDCWTEYITRLMFTRDVNEDMSDVNVAVRSDILEQGEDTLTFLGNYIGKLIQT